MEKKPQCIKPTSYNCGKACININKNCKSNPSDDQSKDRLEKLKVVGIAYAQKASKPPTKINPKKIAPPPDQKPKKVKTPKVAKTKAEKATETLEDRQARLMAEAKAVREKLGSLADKPNLDKSLSEKAVFNVGIRVRTPDPAGAAQKEANWLRDEYNSLLKKNPALAVNFLKERLNPSIEAGKEIDKILIKARGLVQVKTPLKNINAKCVSKNPAKVEEREKAVKEFAKLVSIPDFSGKVVIGDIPAGKSEGSSFFIPGSNTISMSQSHGIHAVVHELAHWLENVRPEIRKEVKAYYDKRTKDEPLTSIGKSPNGGGDILVKKDQWIAPYQGREYSPTSEVTEVLSVGLELLHKNPLFLAKNDPDLFDFIYATVRR
jgi:hypothetical protein